MPARTWLIGDTTNSTYGDVQGNNGVRVTAGRDVIVDANAFILSSDTGAVTATAGRNISLLNTPTPSGNLTGIETAGGNINLTTGVGGVFTDDAGNDAGISGLVSGSVNGGVPTSAAGGNITVSADAMVIDDEINAAGTTTYGIVTLQPVTAGLPITLGTTVAGTLSLLQTGLNEVTASVLRASVTPAPAISPSRRP